MKRSRGLAPLFVAGALLLPGLALLVPADTDDAARHAAGADLPAVASVDAPPSTLAAWTAGGSAAEVAAPGTTAAAAVTSPATRAATPTEVRRRTASALLEGWPDAPVYVGDPRVDRALRRWRELVDRTSVDIDYLGVPLLEALEDLSRRTGLPIVVPPELRELLASSEAHLRLRQITLRVALDLLIEATLGGGYGWRVTPEGCLATQCDGGWGPGPEVVPDERLAQRADGPPERVRSLEEALGAARTDVTTDWRNATLADAFERIELWVGLPMLVDPEIDQARPVPTDVDLSGVPVRQALESLCRPYDLVVGFDLETVWIRPGDEVRAETAERERQEQAWRDLRRDALDAPAGLSGGTPAALARQLEARGIPVVLDDAAAASTTHVPAATADPLLLVCERVAVAAGVAWTVSLPVPDPDDPTARPGLVWRGSSDALEAFLAGLQLHLRGERAEAAVDGAARLERRASTRRQALREASPAQLRDLRLVEDHVSLRLLLRDLVRSVAAADGARHVDGARADLGRVERFGALAGWLSVHGGSCDHPEEGPGVEPPREASCVGCALRWATSLAAWLATDPAPVGHPCAP